MILQIWLNQCTDKITACEIHEKMFTRNKQLNKSNFHGNFTCIFSCEFNVKMNSCEIHNKNIPVKFM